MATDIPVPITQSEKKISAIQYLRGIAALEIVICHFGDIEHHKTISAFLSNGQYGVYVFFVISGFIMTYSLDNHNYQPKNLVKFLAKRSIRIEPAYIISIILILLTYKLPQLTNSFSAGNITFNPGQFAAHLFYLIPFTRWDYYMSIYWTLGVEFQFYLLIGALYFISRSVWFRIGFIVVLGLTSFISLPNSYFLLFTYAPMFTLGMAIMHYYKERNNLYLLVALFSIALIYIHFGWFVSSLVLCTCTLIFLFPSKSPVLSFLGNISYSLYITHAFVLIYLNGIIKKLLPEVGSFELPLLFLKVLIAIGVAFVFYRIVEAPSKRLSEKISYQTS